MPAEPDDVLTIVNHVTSGQVETTATAEGLRGDNARLRALINIGLGLASERDPERLLRNVCAAARDLFAATYVTLGILDRDTRTLVRFVSEGVEGALGIALGDAVPGFLATVVAERRAIRHDAVDTASLGLPHGHPEVHACLAAPVASPSDVYGWIFLARDDESRFTDDDQELVMALAAQVGRIYENAHLYSVARKERDRAQQYLDAAEVLLLGLDLDGRITLVNRYASTLLGWSQADLLGRDFIDTCVPLRLRRQARKTITAAHDGEAAVLDNPVVTRTGEERMIEWRPSYLRDAEGRVLGTLSSGTDVTKRIRSEAEARLQSAALHAAANAIVITGPDGLIRSVNPAFTALTGYSAREAAGRNPGELLKSGRHTTEFYAELWRTILAGQVWRGEMINRRKDGTLYPEQQAITPVRDSDGEITHFIAVKEDVTERRRAEAELHMRVQLSALTTAVGVSFAYTEPLPAALQECAAALIAHLDAAVARIWTVEGGDGLLELQGSAEASTIDPAPLVSAVGRIGQIAADRSSYLTNTAAADPELVDPSWAARESIVGFSGHPLVTGGEVIGVIAVFARHAISEEVDAALRSLADHVALGIERHRTADRLRAADERMRFVLQEAGVGLWDMDFATGQLRWSEFMEVQHRLPPGTFGGTFAHFMERVHPEDRQNVTAAVRGHQGGGNLSLEYRVLWPDGTVRWLSAVRRVILDQHGTPVRAVGISLDVTERRTLEQQYQQAQKMEAIGRLAGGVAHDFNNLLTAILGYCELLLGDQRLHASLREDLEQIQFAGDRAAGLTRQLLAFSRKQVIEPAPLDLNAIVRNMRAMLQRIIREDVKVVLNLSDQLAIITADRGQVEQIIMNLAVNASDAMPAGGTLTITTTNADLEGPSAGKVSLAPGAYVALIVTDTGNGMSADVQARLFEAFFTTKEAGKGTGLGLATVHSIVTRSGGGITVSSELGLGASFCIYLPQSNQGLSSVEPVPMSGAVPGAAHTILVVDDADELRELAKRLLERQGYSVLSAGSAADAIRMFQENSSIDLVLTDVVMPGASGPDVARELMTRRPQLKVIYMSGYTDDAIVHHGVLKPGVAFLQKPFTSETLTRKIRETLETA